MTVRRRRVRPEEPDYVLSELLLILVIALVFFGGSKLPDLAKSLGNSMKKGKKGIAAELEEDSRSSTPARSATITSTAPRTCSSCQSPMDVAWTHCPRCGTIGVSDSTPTPPK
ncbi:MAG: twin-arginine translocase TatA/TatE family subunit [bacterium]